MEQQKKNSITDSAWSFLASVKLAITVFALIALTSVVGTVLEQGAAEPQRNLEILTKLFGPSLAPSLYGIFSALGFMDMYHSWWFMALLAAFSVNMVICSLERLPRILRLMREPMEPLTAERISRSPINRSIVMKGKPEKVRETLIPALAGLRFRFSEVREETGFQLLSHKGGWSRLGVYITHFSILVILLGALIGMQFGFKSFLSLPEGMIADGALSESGREVPFNFGIRCDSFEVDFYGGSDMPKEYRSWLTVIENGKEVLRKAIAVNDPLTYKGLTFYQSSYGVVPGTVDKGIFIFNLIPKGGAPTPVHPPFGTSFEIPGTGITGKITNFSPALQFDEHGHVSTYTDMMNNPAVFIEFSQSGKPLYSQWLLKRHPGTWELPDGNRVEFIDYWGVEYTGLQVRRDPGVWVVYFGCIALSAGLFIAFFMSHRKIWVKVVEEKNQTRVIIGASSNKNRAGLERRIDKVISVLGK